ncbi:Arf GTPase activating protein [Rickenella mellea]|uniref:Arf GTPase activating protein n=1 Tax=Rickenella mellea TaxID=50990 RepID=A0A4Y7PPF0_9AGAM|nr:Arf GTPase activating protein [Rickenella mellea]
MDTAVSGMDTASKERARKLLNNLKSESGNNTCADCYSPAPTWAAVNLGIFICEQCATVHRKIGSQVKSLILDTWAMDQVENMRNIGNLRANERWNSDGRLAPPPADMEESERDSALETYIREKYEGAGE